MMPTPEEVERHAREHPYYDGYGGSHGGLWITRDPEHPVARNYPSIVRLKTEGGVVMIENGFSFWQPLRQCRWAQRATYTPVTADAMPLDYEKLKQDLAAWRELALTPDD